MPDVRSVHTLVPGFKTEGGKGKCRVEVEGDWEPFEVEKEPPHWFSVQ